MRQKGLFVLLLGACNLMVACSTGWQINVNGTANGLDSARAVTVTNADDVVAAGFTENTGTGFGFTVVKFSGRQGKELWRRVINGPTNPSNTVNQATAVRTDSAGDVLAVGVIYNTETLDDVLVVKFDGANRTELWRQVINGSGNRYDVARSVVLDPSRNVITAGDTLNLRRYSDFTVIKFDGVSGTELWRQVITGSDKGGSEATEVAADARGDVLAVGFITNSETGNDFAVVKLDGLSGTVLWTKTISGMDSPLFDMAHAVTVDLAGDVIAAGYLANILTDDDFTVIKLDGTSGAERWRKVINGTANGADDRALAVTADVEGNVVAAGHIRNTETLDDFTVIKLEGVSGAELWRQMINGDANGEDWAGTVSVDVTGDVVAAGATKNKLTGTDFTVVRFDGASGKELWRKVINGTANDVDAADAVATDSAGNAVAVGRTRNAGTGDDFTVVKLTASEGGF